MVRLLSWLVGVFAVAASSLFAIGEFYLEYPDYYYDPGYDVFYYEDPVWEVDLYPSYPVVDWVYEYPVYIETPPPVYVYPHYQPVYQAPPVQSQPVWEQPGPAGGGGMVPAPQAPNRHYHPGSQPMLAPTSPASRWHAPAPTWLQTGVPLYQSGQWGQDGEMGRYLSAFGVPTFPELEGNPYHNGGRCTALDASLVAYIAQTRGPEALLALLQDYSRFEQIMGQSKEQVRERWIAYLQAGVSF